MAVQVSYPGVYIEEFAPAAPIQGVGTSTAAFIGIAARGPLDTPTKLTSWDRFREVFGDQPAPGFLLWFAARGFFENGGQVCYIVRASNGAYGRLTINTHGGARPLFDVQAREPGAIAISAGTQRTNLLTNANTTLYQPTATLAAGTAGDTQIALPVADASRFRPGDVITLAAGGEELPIVRIVPGTPNSQVLLGKPLANTYAAAAVRLANTGPGQRTFRIRSTVPLPPNALVEGAMLTFTQGTSRTQIVESIQVERLNATDVTYRVTLRQPLGLALDLASATTVQSEEFTLTVQHGGTTTYTGLALDSVHPRYYLRIINDNPDAAVTLVPREPPPPIAMPDNMPVNTALTPLAGGTAENLATLADQDFLDALETLRSIDDVNLVAVPDRQTTGVQQAVVAHCELLGDRFAVLDSRAGLEPFAAGGVLTQRGEVDSTRGYAALYYPWLRVLPAGRGAPILVPPSGHVCGIIARSDNARGVHKAPANEIVNGALGVERLLGDIDHGQLNIVGSRPGVNVIRVFQSGGRPVLYGARTTATDLNWQYVNIRRLFLYLEESIQDGIRWAVFEPNNKALWKKLERSIGDFLNTAWRDGALFGAKASEAYYVRIDDQLNPFSEQALGRLHIEIGVRPSYPAEFIVVRIGIWAGGSDVSES